MSIGLVRLGFFFHGLGGRGGREGCGTWVDGQAVILIADDDAFTCLLTIFFFFFLLHAPGWSIVQMYTVSFSVFLLSLVIRALGLVFPCLSLALADRLMTGYLVLTSGLPTCFGTALFASPDNNKVADRLGYLVSTWLFRAEN